MPDSDPNVFADDGSINPQWLQHITNEDAVVSEITAYFLPGKKLKPEAKCLMAECVMPNRTGKVTTPTSTEYNPMMLCFFCNRVFHAGCMDLDSNLILEETVPWKCCDCKRDVLNQHCQTYFKETKYKVCLIKRRSKFLTASGSPEKEEKLSKELEFDKTDLASFERRALQILAEEDPEVINNPGLVTAYVLKRVMQQRADKKRALEVSERFRKELERVQAQLKETTNRNIQQHEATANTSMADQSISFQVPLSSTMLPGNRPTAVLSNLYTGGNTTASIEISNTSLAPIRENNSGSTENVTNIQNNSSTIGDNSQAMNSTDFTTLLQRLTVSQERDERRNLENLRRRALPKIAEFKGEESKWLAFKQDVDRYREHLGHDEVALKYYVKGALKGEAYEIVRDLFDAESLDVIMATLKLAFGDEMRMVRNRGEELKNFKFNSTLYRIDAIKLQSAIQSYFAACRYANIGYINTNAIAESIFCQFNQEDRLRCKDFYCQKYPAASTIVMDVQTIYEYLLRRIPLLDEGPVKKKPSEPDPKAKSKPFQSFNVTISSPKSNENFKFEIKDKIKAPYIGYDLDKVADIKKECNFCSSSEHYSLQCPRYKEKSENDRLKWINDKGVCKNCILTTSHRAQDCDLKSNCGFKVDKSSRCCSRHHISIHDASNNAQRSSRANNSGKRRSNTKNNSANVKKKIEDAKNNDEPPSNQNDETTANTGAAFHTIDPRQFKLTYKVNVGSVGDTNNGNDPPKTVKVFRVKLWGPKGYVVALVVGDSGSEVTLVRNDLREALNIKGKSHTLHLQWADSSGRTSNVNQFDMQIQSMEEGAPKFQLKNCFGSDDLYLPERTLDMKKLRQQFHYLKNIPFEGYLNEHPVILIGAPHAHLIEGCELVDGGGDGPIAVKTRIGWSVYGGMTHVGSSKTNSIAVSSLTEATNETVDPIEETGTAGEKVSNELLHKMLVEHFSVESLGIRAAQTHLTEEEKNAIEILNEEVKVLEGGFIEAPLVWNRNKKVIPRLPNNYSAVLQRQLAEERKLMKSPIHHEAYNNNVKELIALQFLREADQNDMNREWPNIWYLPMSLVINNNKVPPKMRNVYDASSVYKGTSLNANLLKGPDLLVNIINPLIQMRMNRIAFTADVKAMFNMIKICPRDQQCQRILFRENVETPMKTYISTVMLFGPTSSPFTSQYVKNKTAEKWKDKYPDAARTLIESTYMDDVLTSEPTVEKATAVARQCIEICKSINWQLVAFQSNSIELLNSLPPNTVKQEAIPLPETEAESHVTKVLGCQWNTMDDCFEFKLEGNLFIQLVKDFDQKPSKRDQASTLARIYDVLGLISHFTIRGKIYLQRSWENKIGWDEIISDKAAKDWKKWLEQINDIAKLKFPRRFTQIDALNDAEDIHLHVFCDAGAEAFGAVAYIVVQANGKIDSSIVMAKAKVTPLRLKTETAVKEMPRLELMAALLAVRLSKTITNAVRIDRMKHSYWCDSEVVLRWILNPNQKLVKYAIGPVEEILELTERDEWQYVPTELNVADLCTKMKKFDFSCNESVWMIGPDFIRLNEENWPKLPDKLRVDDYTIANNIYLEKLKYSTHELPPISCPIANDNAIDRFSASIKSTWSKHTRATARALKLFMDVFIPLVRTKQLCNEAIVKQLRDITKQLTHLEPTDIERAEHFIFRKIQHDEFPEEYKALSTGKTVRNPMMQQLNVFMDPQGIIRINARANVNDECYPQQFAPLLPRKNVYVTNLLAYYHYKYEHIATEAQIAEIRTKAWIPQLKMALRSIKSKCNWCKIKNAMPYSPKMAPLPEDRVNADLKPFEVTGIDILGPLRPTVNGNIKKVYILIFVCALTRYIHLHILDSMESLRVLEAIVSFWTAYGPVRKFISDNATNFKRTAKTLEEDFHREQFFNKQQSMLGPKLSEIYRVEWQFIPAHSPWCGGMYERLIKEVKRSLFSTLQRRKINRIELNIAVQETAHRINCRPLTENPLDAADSEILTPHHLVKNKSGWPLLPGIHKNIYTTIPDRSIYKRGRAVADEMMQRFTARYLPILTKRTKWHKTEAPPRVGDLVLVIEPNKTRREWQRARIIKVHIGKDGTARVADVVMANGKVKRSRSLRNLAKLNLSKSLHETDLTVAQKSNLTVAQNSKTLVSSIFELSTAKNVKAPAGNFTLIDTIEISSSWSRLLENINYIAMKRSSSFVNNSSLIVQVDGVSRSMKLSKIVETLQPEIHSIIGIARVRDYAKETDLNSIFLFLMDRQEYARLLSMHRSIQLKPGMSIAFPNLTLGSAYFKQSFETIDEETIRAVPKPLALFGLPVMSCNSSMYVANLLKTFEVLVDVKAFRWCVAEARIMTRTFGFLLLPSRAQVMQLVNRDYIVGDGVLEAKTSNSATILIHEVDSYLINDQRKAILTEKIAQANWLNGKFNQPDKDLKAIKITIHQAPRQSTPVTTAQSALERPPDLLDSQIHMVIGPNEIVPEDSLVLTLDENESFGEEPCCSKSLPVVHEAVKPSETGDDLRNRPTVALKDGSSDNKKAKKAKSRYMRLIINNKYSLETFKRKISCLMRRYSRILFVERSDSSLVFIEFEDEKSAIKFKMVIEGLREENSDCSISHSDSIAKKHLDKACSHTLKAKTEDEKMYLINTDGLMAQCAYGREWTVITFDPPKNVANSDSNE